MLTCENCKWHYCDTCSVKTDEQGRGMREVSVKLTEEELRILRTELEDLMATLSDDIYTLEFHKNPKFDTFETINQMRIYLKSLRDLQDKIEEAKEKFTKEVGE